LEGEGESEGAKGVVGLDLGRVDGGGDSIDEVTVAAEGEGEVGDSEGAGPLTASAKESLLARRGEPSAYECCWRMEILQWGWGRGEGGSRLGRVCWRNCVEGRGESPYEWETGSRVH
jgi:hypothetical protein